MIKAHNYLLFKKSLKAEYVASAVPDAHAYVIKYL